MLLVTAFILSVGCGSSLSFASAVRQLVSPYSVSTVRIPGISLGSRSGINLETQQMEAGMEEGSGIDPDHTDTESIETKTYFTSNFNGNLNMWSVTPNNKVRTIKSLCYSPKLNNSSMHLNQTDVSVAIFSNSRKYLDFSLKGVENPDFLLSLDREIEFVVSNHSTRVFQFDRGLHQLPQEEHYLLSIESVTNHKQCVHVGISNPDCPWNDGHRTVRNNKIWARILSLGYFSIKANKFPKSFVIIILPTEENESCSSSSVMRDESVTKKLRMKITVSSNSFKNPIIASLVFLIVPSVVFLLILFCFWRNKFKNHEHCTLSKNCEEEKIDINVEDHEHDYRINNLDEPDGEKVCSKCIELAEKRKKLVFLPDLIEKYTSDRWHRKLRSLSYLYLVPLVSLFYIIPSAQMVFLNRTGSDEACFFNYGCARPWWIFDSFNHIYSNVGYIWFGVVFICLVKIKSHYFPEDRDSNLGLPQQYSVFYAMGLAMVFQGILSCIFHVCPSNLSLQFDTTMMYLIMTLVFVKIYQFRHPDTTINAYLCMFTLCLALIFEALSIYVVRSSVTKTLFVSVFSLIYFSVIMYLGINFYFNRSIKKSWHLRKNVEKLRKKLQEPGLLAHKLRFITSVMFVVVNVLVFVYVLYSLGSKGTSLSTPFILIFGGNMFIYVTYYMGRKILDILQSTLVQQEKHQEVEQESNEVEPSEEDWLPWLARIIGVECKEEEANEHREGESGEEVENPCQMNLIRWFSFILFGVSMIIGFIALAFYANKHQSRSLTPPESRERNQLCKFGDFFDNHDMWHFLSSFALFLAFLGLLTVDDDLLYVNRKNIKVF